MITLSCSLLRAERAWPGARGVLGVVRQALSDRHGRNVPISASSGPKQLEIKIIFLSIIIVYLKRSEKSVRTDTNFHLPFSHTSIPT